VEEIVFRSYMIALMRPTHSNMELILISPLYFGFAHLHHGFQIYRENGSDGFALKKAVLVVTAQFCYTTLFGLYSAYCLLQSGVFTCILIHMFCNYMGLPDFSTPSLHVPGLVGFFLIHII
jgi:prenyl protein peptidase